MSITAENLSSLCAMGVTLIVVMTVNSHSLVQESRTGIFQEDCSEFHFSECHTQEGWHSGVEWRYADSVSV